ncbi:MAG: hypothetical protein ACRDNS_02765 [Trebonia sp.]
MLFLAERPASPSTGRAPEAGERAGEAEALIKEARRRRRRRWIRGTGAVLLVAAGATTWIKVEYPTAAPRAATVTASRPATVGTCASAVAYGPLPTWARSGFQPPNIAMPYVLGARGDIVAVLWARHDPLITPTPPDRANKILWVSKLSSSAGPDLQITAQRLVDGTTVGQVERRAVAGGPGPSTIDMPTAGCWQFTLRWSGHTDTVNLPYAAG